MMNKNLSKVILASLLGGSLLGNALYANTALAADVTDKTKVVDGTETTGQIAGEATGTDNANNNTLIITGNGEITGNNSAIGGRSEEGNANDNSVLIHSGGKVGHDVYGGYSDRGSANDNTVTINGDANGSKVIIGNDVYGGYAENDGDANDNSVIITGAEVGDEVYGGYSTADSNGNQVIISDSKITSNVHGGATDTSSGDSANDNIVSISGGKVDAEVYGGSVTGDGNAIGNTVTISGGQVVNIYGGSTSGQGNANGNMIIIDQDCYITSMAAGGYANTGNTNDNTVILANITIENNLYGGYTATGNADNNVVHISDSTISSFLYGGYTNTGNANDNTITISGDSSVGEELCGGYTNTGNANGNTVTINSGSTIDDNVYGGSVGGTGDAINNTVNISGDVTFDAGSVLYGGNSSGGGKVREGNTLNIASAGLSLGNVANFENYNFYLTDANINNAAAVLNLQTSSNTNLDKANINSTLSGAACALNVGDTVKLLHNSNGFDTNDITTGTTLQQGFSLIYGIELDTTSTDSVNFTVTEGGRATEASKSPSETRLATVGFLNSGADNFTDKGIANAVAVASSDNGAVFAAAGGGQSRLHSGSYTDIKGYNFALGAAKAITNNAGKLTYGPFAEAGWGTYDSHLDYGVRGDGNTRYYGVGAFARQDNNSGTYYEGSLRYGQTNSDYSGSGLTDGLGNALTATYDSSSTYYGAHIGIGKVSKLTDTTSADVYTKLLYTHQQGDSAVMAGSGETYDFDAVDSTRARVGARLSKDYSTRATAYVGTAYEYEFDGEATATVKGFSTLAPSIKGGSGMLELGYSLKPKAANDPTIDLSLQGWLGKKEGFTTNVNFMWKF